MEDKRLNELKINACDNVQHISIKEMSSELEQIATKMDDILNKYNIDEIYKTQQLIRDDVYEYKNQIRDINTKIKTMTENFIKMIDILENHKNIIENINTSLYK